jgi:aminoglycoside phosphotransferase (APT) family kinase protein
VVIDWTNARRGAPAFDVAYTWVIAATSDGHGPLFSSFVDHFLSHFDRLELLRSLPLAAESRMADVNVTDAERKAVRRLAEHAGIELQP